MKKIILICSVIAVTVLSVTGCGQKTETENGVDVITETETSSESTTETVTENTSESTLEATSEEMLPPEPPSDMKAPDGQPPQKPDGEMPEPPANGERPEGGNPLSPNAELQSSAE